MTRIAADTLHIQGIKGASIGRRRMTTNERNRRMTPQAKGPDAGSVLIGNGECGAKNGIASGIGHHRTGP